MKCNNNDDDYDNSSFLIFTSGSTLSISASYNLIEDGDTCNDCGCDSDGNGDDNKLDAYLKIMKILFSSLLKHV